MCVDLLINLNYEEKNVEFRMAFQNFEEIILLYLVIREALFKKKSFIKFLLNLGVWQSQHLYSFHCSVFIT